MQSLLGERTDGFLLLTPYSPKCISCVFGKLLTVACGKVTTVYTSSATDYLKDYTAPALLILGPHHMRSNTREILKETDRLLESPEQNPRALNIVCLSFSAIPLAEFLLSCGAEQARLSDIVRSVFDCKPTFLPRPVSESSALAAEIRASISHGESVFRSVSGLSRIAPWLT